MRTPKMDSAGFAGGSCHFQGAIDLFDMVGIFFQKEGGEKTRPKITVERVPGVSYGLYEHFFLS